MKKPVAASLVVLALAFLHVTPSFADTDASSSVGSKPAKKPKKASHAPKAAKPKKVATSAPVAVAAPEPAAADPTPMFAPPAAPPVPQDAADAARAPASARESLDAADPAPSPAFDDDQTKHLALAPLIGYASDGLKLGFGARASYTFSNHVSVAGTFVYHLGTSEDGVAINGASASSSVHAFYPGAEGGYDFHIDHATIRPYFGVAALFVSASTKLGDQESSDTKSHFAIYPGVTANYEIPQTAFFAGADMRLLVVTDGGDPSFGFFGTFGMRL